MLRKCLYKCLFRNFFPRTCVQYVMLFDRCVSNSHVISCLNLCMFRAARFSSGGLGLWVFWEGVVGCEVWNGKGKGRRSWVEERGKAFAIVQRQGEDESQHQANHFVLLPISSSSSFFFFLFLSFFGNRRPTCQRQSTWGGWSLGELFVK